MAQMHTVLHMHTCITILHNGGIDGLSILPYIRLLQLVTCRTSCRAAARSSEDSTALSWVAASLPFCVGFDPMERLWICVQQLA